MGKEKPGQQVFVVRPRRIYLNSAAAVFAAERGMLWDRMDPTLIVLLFAVVAFAAALYYLYVRKGWYDWGQRARAGIIVLIGVLAPVLVMTLLQQNDAKDALAAQGISLHPGLGSSVGIATGSVASGNNWVFQYDGDRSTLLDYYRDAAHRDGWEIAEDNDVFLILKREDQHLMISATEDAAIFQLSRSASQSNTSTRGSTPLRTVSMHPTSTSNS